MFYVIYFEPSHLACKTSQVQLLEEAGPTSPRNLIIELSRLNDDTDNDDENDSNHHEERTGMTTSSLEISTESGKPSNKIPSSPTNFSCDIDHGVNSHARKNREHIR